MLKTDLRFCLRERTATAHNAVEHAVGAFETVEDYKKYVAGMAAFRLPLEAQLSSVQWPEFFGDWRPQFIGAELRSDLTDLRLPVPANNDASSLSNEAEFLLGVSYVLEGSSLGSKILHKRALGLGLDETFGARHLALQSGATANWRAFLDLLGRDEGLAADPIVTAANLTFQMAQQAFETTSATIESI